MVQQVLTICCSLTECNSSEVNIKALFKVHIYEGRILLSEKIFCFMK